MAAVFYVQAVWMETDQSNRKNVPPNVVAADITDYGVYTVGGTAVDSIPVLPDGANGWLVHVISGYLLVKASSTDSDPSTSHPASGQRMVMEGKSDFFFGEEGWYIRFLEADTTP